MNAVCFDDDSCLSDKGRKGKNVCCGVSLRQVKRNGRKLAEAFLVKLTDAVYSIELLAELKTGKSDKSLAHKHT